MWLISYMTAAACPCPTWPASILSEVESCYDCQTVFPMTCDRELYERFFDAFAHEGEPNIPIDRQIMQSPEFYHLLERLRQHAELHQRDHW